jgi:hypothetical protein
MSLAYITIDPDGNNMVLLEGPAAGEEESDEEEDDDPFESAANLKYLRLGACCNPFFFDFISE